MERGPTTSLTLVARVNAATGNLSPAELRVAKFMAANPQEVVLDTAEVIGRRSKSSDATVVRTVQSLGYKGLQELKKELAHELSLRVDPAKRLQDRLHNTRHRAGGFENTVFQDAIDRLTQIQQSLDRGAVQMAISVLVGTNSIFTWGLGSLSPEAQYAALRLKRLGRRAFPITATGFNLSDDLLLQQAGDVVLMYARGRRTKDVDAIIENSRLVGAKVILVTASLTAELGSRVDVLLETGDTHSGQTREAFGASIVTDVLMLGIAERSEAGAVDAARRLSGFRERLLGDSKRSK